jgi:hypothetical protein
LAALKKTNTMKKTLLLLTAIASLTIASHAHGGIFYVPKAYQYGLSPLCMAQERLDPKYGSWSYSDFQGIHIEYRWSFGSGQSWYQGVINQRMEGYCYLRGPFYNMHFVYVLWNGKFLHWDKDLHPAPGSKTP